MDFIDPKIEKYASDHTSPESDLLERLKKETYENLLIPQMLTGRLEGRFLKLLAQLLEARRILEVGTFSGYGSLSMAEALPEDGRLYTCEEDPDAIQMAQKFFDESPHGGKIEILKGQALENIASLKEPLDMAFIDADKVNYLNYYEAILPLIRPGGLIVADNVLWSGRVLNPEDETDHALHRFNETVCKDERVEGVMLPIRDGVFCLRKK